MKHTQGKWVAVPQNNPATFTKYIAVQIPTNGFIAVAGEDSEANAKLIAAAPSMLEALKEALDQLESWNQESEPTFTMRRIDELINTITR